MKIFYTEKVAFTGIPIAVHGSRGERLGPKGTRLEAQAVYLFAGAMYREEVHCSNAQYIIQHTPLSASRGALPPSRQLSAQYPTTHIPV
jgi:hypothetical protein